MKNLINKTSIALTLCLSIVSINLSAQHHTEEDNTPISTKKSDRVKLKKAHKLKYEEFIAQYGTDDTSIAIINIYFDKRENFSGSLMSFTPVCAGIAIICPPIGVPLTIISSPALAIGLVVRNKYNKKHLLKILNSYHNEGLVANKLQTQINNYMEGEIEYFNDNELAKL